MMSTSLETGLGLTRMLLLSGLTGLRDSPTTSMDRTAWLCRRCMTSSSPCSETTSGMTLLVISMLTIFVKILVLKNLIYVVSQYKEDYWLNIYHGTRTSSPLSLVCSIVHSIMTLCNIKYCLHEGFT